jgi:hypothetical protein
MDENAYGRCDKLSKRCLVRECVRRAHTNKTAPFFTSHRVFLMTAIIGKG